MFPPRLSVMSLNLWGEQRWTVREPAVKACLETLRPDVLCLQELTARTRERLDVFLPDHERVDGDHPGWTSAGNVYWRSDRLTEVTHGAADVSLPEPGRRLFWVRLSLPDDDDRTLVVASAHLTYQLNERERDTGRSPRVEQTKRIVAELDDVAGETEPVLFAGDLNDPIHPYRVLSESGYSDCFSDLGHPVRATFPARATRSDLDTVVEVPYDWIFGNDAARSMAATVTEFYHDDVAPSDHWPVIATYELSV